MGTITSSRCTWTRGLRPTWHPPIRSQAARKMASILEPDQDTIMSNTIANGLQHMVTHALIMVHSMPIVVLLRMKRAVLVEVELLLLRLLKLHQLQWRKQPRQQRKLHQLKLLWPRLRPQPRPQPKLLKPLMRQLRRRLKLLPVFNRVNLYHAQGVG